MCSVNSACSIHRKRVVIKLLLLLVSLLKLQFLRSCACLTPQIFLALGHDKVKLIFQEEVSIALAGRRYKVYLTWYLEMLELWHRVQDVYSPNKLRAPEASSVSRLAP